MPRKGMSKYEYVKTQEYADYLNSPEVIEAVRKVGVAIRGFKERRRKLREKHKNS
jgi:hypothetical protein